jgi:pimeloyl-ACP methyl ester carboxylesterase
MGYSLGSDVALQTAIRHPDVGRPARARVRDDEEGRLLSRGGGGLQSVGGQRCHARR